MFLILQIAIGKTFGFLKIFGIFAPIVKMIKSVIYDLRIFTTFFFILMVLFSLLLGVIGVGNPNIEGAYEKYKIEQEAGGEADEGWSGQEY